MHAAEGNSHLVVEGAQVTENVEVSLASGFASSQGTVTYGVNTTLYISFVCEAESHNSYLILQLLE